MPLPAVEAISDMVAAVVLITSGVLIANELLSSYTVLNERVRTLRRERLAPDHEHKLEIDLQFLRDRALLHAVQNR